MLRWRGLAAIVRDASGVAAIEFGVLSMPLLILLFGGLDLAHQSYIRSVLNGALGDAARRAAVQKPDFLLLGSTTEKRIGMIVGDSVARVAPGSSTTITIKNFEEFSGVNSTEKLMVDNNGNGSYDASDRDCFEDLNGNGQFDTDGGRSGLGGASDVVYYDAVVTVPHLLPWNKLIGGSRTYTVRAQTVMRNQPYADSVPPAVLCG